MYVNSIFVVMWMHAQGYVYPRKTCLDHTPM